MSEDAAAHAPLELIVDAKAAPGDASDGSGTAMAPVLLPVAAGALLAKLVSPLAGLAGLVLAIALLVALRKPSEGRFVLRVDEGFVEILRERRKEPVARFKLDDLLDVTLEKESRQGGRGGATERMRIALERAAPAEPIHLPEERITPLEAQEWQGKVRVFLRKHGWLPRDERA